ncbi:MAG: glycosyltransferase [Coprobacter sp.]|nr:glycosyltransferase [Coprobacter sp.]
MTKPILVDALHINTGGALMILNHLVDRLVARNVNFVLLKDERCPGLRSECAVPEVVVMSSGERSRKRYYKSCCNSFSAVLCLGNIPPAIKMPVPVHTYIHNVSLLKIQRSTPVKLQIKNYVKRSYIRYRAANTDTWVVQTENTANLVNRYINRLNRPVLVLPFYHIPADICKTPVEERYDYVFVGENTWAKGHEDLIKAWAILAQKGVYPTLHLTTKSLRMVGLIAEARALGAQIDNHGYVSFEEVIELYNRSKATVYPSLNESLGLGIIEAAEAGCDVIGCDLPYLYSVCEPSEVFQPQAPHAIAEAVLRYEMSPRKKTALHVRDRVDDLIRLISEKVDNLMIIK